MIVENVGINATRAGLFDILRAMGGHVEYLNKREVGGEPVADIRVRHSVLKGIAVPADIAPSMIDEFPVLFVAAALAEGRTVTTGLEELRVKESDRIALMAEGLTAIGAHVTETEDGMIIDGTGGALLAGGASVATKLDHRIAMSFAIAGLMAKAPVTIDDMTPVATSFPQFTELMTALGAVRA